MIRVVRDFSRAAAVVAAALVLTASLARAAEKASADDTAKILAGMPPTPGSPLGTLTADRQWQNYAQALDRSFESVEKRQLAPIRTWVKANMPPAQPAMFYMFGGPDFLYANAFFPNAKTYVQVGLEPSGPIPEIGDLRKRGGIAGLGRLQSSMRTLLAASFFITKDMQVDLHGGPLRGTLPIIYIFMARSGKDLVDVSLVEIDDSGAVQPDSGPKSKASARGAKIVFKSPGGSEQTLYYLSTNLENSGTRKGGFFKFLESLGPADSFVKSASYLMHGNNFSNIRDFLVKHSVTVLEDDSGIPLRYFDTSKWKLTPYGNYLPPFAEMFPGTYQPKLKELFVKAPAAKLPFGAGYRWRPGESNLLLATSKDPVATAAK